MSVETMTVNGNKVRYSPNLPSSEQHARRFSAAIGQAHPSIERISFRSTRKVVAWVSDTEGRIDAPDGWDVEGVYVTSTGNVAVRFEVSE